MPTATTELPLKKGVLTRQKIIRRAAPIFNQQGFHGTSIDDILLATGLQKGGFYRHFASKEALAIAVFRYSVSVYEQRIVQTTGKYETPAEQLLGLFRLFDAMALAPLLPGGCPVMNTGVESDDTHALLRDETREVLIRWRGLWESLIQAGMDQGQFRPDLDVQSLATTVLASLEGAILLMQVHQDPSFMGQVTRQLAFQLNTQWRMPGELD